MRMSKSFSAIGFLFLFIWISFFPQPIQDKYGIYVKVFLAIFLLVLILNKKYRQHIFSSGDWPSWLFMICLLAGIISAIDKGLAIRTYSQLVVIFLLLFYIGKAIFVYDKDRNMVCTVICICSSLVAIIGIMELYFGMMLLSD